MSDYIFESHENDLEHQRLKGIEVAFDQNSISCLKKVGLQAGARCLEIGPGAGSLMRWMGREVGPSGLVLGIDKSTKYVTNLQQAPFRVIEGDFSEVEFEADFDLIHARYVLIHNQNAGAMLDRVREKLRPGGAVVLEEPDFSCAIHLNDAKDLAQQRVNRSISRLFESLGLNPAYGLSLPQELLNRGFFLKDVISNLHLAPGGSPVAKVMSASARALREKYIATGEAKASDVEAYLSRAEDQQHCSVYYATISVIATRPV